MNIVDVKRLVIVGGGTAGWLAASHFSRRWHRKIEVTIIDKSKPDRIGVGEATLLNFPNVMRQMGYQPEEWIPKVDATFKSGIRFPGWGKEDSEIWHPFGFCSLGTPPVPLYDIWTNFQEEGTIRSISALYGSGTKGNVELDYLHEAYAFQLDCGKLVSFLQMHTENFLNYIQSDVTDVIKNGDDIEKLILEDGREIEADLFIDCTGFKRLLFGQEDTIDLSDRLFINSAVASRVQYKSDDEKHPYTDCEAVEHGWIWKIPTKTRIGTGYCFNRDVTDPELIMDSFVKHWDNRINKDDLKLIKWDPRMSSRYWKGNVVAIGLSSGFIEPLESTGLALMIRQIEYLEEGIYGPFYNKDVEIQAYNSRVNAAYETAVDYINMHYAYSERKGKFWDYVRSKWKKSGMQQFMEDQIMNDGDTYQGEKLGSFFGGSNWHVWLAQLMPYDIPAKTYWHDRYNDIVQRYRKYIAEKDKNVLESVSQSAVLSQYYDQ